MLKRQTVVCSWLRRRQVPVSSMLSECNTLWVTLRLLIVNTSLYGSIGTYVTVQRLNCQLRVAVVSGILTEQATIAVPWDGKLITLRHSALKCTTPDQLMNIRQIVRIFGLKVRIRASVKACLAIAML